MNNSLVLSQSLARALPRSVDSAGTTQRWLSGCPPHTKQLLVELL